MKWIGPDRSHLHPWQPRRIEADRRLPNYFNDLNAMHEAEKVLQAQCKYWPDYIAELARMFLFNDMHKDQINWSQCIHATAAQRAEAFLRCLGKWDDTL